VIDGDGRMVRANRAACDLLRRAEPRVLALPVSELVDPPDQGRMEVQLELVASGAIERVRHQLRFADEASETWVEITVRRVELAHGSELYLAASVEDVSDRVRGESCGASPTPIGSPACGTAGASSPNSSSTSLAPAGTALPAR
jgi:PAS domain S-box-containing protein